MNSINIIGRLTRDAELKNSGVAVCKFTVAVDRDFKNKSGEKEADFINCIIFNKAAESLSQYLVKGKLVGITGRVQTGNYTNKDGIKIYTFDVIVEKTKFLDSKGGQSSSQYNPNTGDDNSFGSTSDITPIDDGDIPF
jgi:single-strand DNA-binding protein